MNIDTAYAQIRTLGTIFRDALVKAGKPVDNTVLVHGLAAYTKLNLKGEDAQLDIAYSMVMDDMMNAVRKEVTPNVG
jgi:hypothetical protein